MRARAKARAPQRRVLGVRRYKGCRLTRLGSETVEIALPSGAVWGWAASWAQARRVVEWIQGLGEERL